MGTTIQLKEEKMLSIEQTNQDVEVWKKLADAHAEEARELSEKLRKVNFMLGLYERAAELGMAWLDAATPKAVNVEPMPAREPGPVEEKP
jgi:hypothetical protein